MQHVLTMRSLRFSAANVQHVHAGIFLGTCTCRYKTVAQCMVSPTQTMNIEQLSQNRMYQITLNKTFIIQHASLFITFIDCVHVYVPCNSQICAIWKLHCAK